MEEVTIKDIAKICGVGVSTVSRAINNHPDINPETKQMILDVIRENGYIPNNSARNLKRVDAKSIAVLVKGMSNPFFSSMIKIMEEETKKKHYAMVLRHVDFNEDEVDVALELVKEKRLRGIVFLGGYFHHVEEKLEKLTVPFILSTVGGQMGMVNNRYSSVSVDDEMESYRMTSYLLEHGHKAIALLSAECEDESVGKLRLNGYKRALKAHGIEVRPELIREMRCDIELYSLRNGYEVMRKLLATKEKFTAVYAISDMIALGACRAILESGKKIPEDYAVTGFDGLELGEYYTPSLTTIKQPVEQIAKETMRLLFEILAGREINQHKILNAELIERESTWKSKENLQ